MLTGTFPYWVDTLPELQVVVLRGNKLKGTLYNSNNKTPFPKLRILDLSSNEFTGNLPENYFNNFKAMMSVNGDTSGDLYMGGNLTMYQDKLVLVVKGLRLELERILVVYTTIDLSVNKFQGEIPDTIGKLTSLRFLNLSHNSLTGEIPVPLKDLRLLESLDLSSNKMVGKIPLELRTMTFLAVVNFSQNQFQGSIPEGGQFNTFENNSYQGNVGLCGFPLTKNCGDDEVPLSPTPVQDDDDDDSGFFNGFSWESVALGYGFGSVIGLGIGWLMFHYGRPRWVIRIVERQHERKAIKTPPVKVCATGRASRRKKHSQVFDVNSAMSF